MEAVEGQWPGAMLDQKLKKAGAEVITELMGAIKHHGPMRSGHEGWAVIMEEVDELWEEVRKNPKKLAGGSTEHIGLMRAEARQVAAMAIRFMVDVC